LITVTSFLILLGGHMGDDLGVESPKDKSIVDFGTHEPTDKVFPMSESVSAQRTIQEFAYELHSLVA
jgi:hypothetical protein